MKKLFIVRGLPGTNTQLLVDCIISRMEKDSIIPSYVSSEVFFEVNFQTPSYELEDIKKSHIWCNNEVRDLMEKEKECIIVSNPFPKVKHMFPYMRLAKNFNYEVSVYESFMYSGDTNISLPSIISMNKKWESCSPFNIPLKA